MEPTSQRMGSWVPRYLIVAAVVMSAATLLLVFVRWARLEEPIMPPAAAPLIADREHAAYLKYEAGNDEGCLAACEQLPIDNPRRYYIEALVAERTNVAEAIRLYKVAHRMGDTTATLQLRFHDARMQMAVGR